MPSSLTVNLSSALVFSTRPPVSVSGTGRLAFKRPPAGFLGSLLHRPSVTPKGFRTFQPRPGSFLLPVAATLLTAQFRLRGDASLLRHRGDSCKTGCGILTACPSTIACRRGVRSRLTLNRLALFRNPWSFGEGVSLPLCRYLYLHLLFLRLQPVSRPTFADEGMLPYQSYIRTIPWLRHRTYARLLSTRGRSTSELLRTL